MPLGIRRSHRLIADSRATKDDLVKLMGSKPDEVDVVPLGLNEPHPERAMPEPELREKHELGHRAVALSLSAKRPHKNLMRLLDALARIPAERRPVLVIPGYKTWHENELNEHAHKLGVENDVRILGWVDEAEIEGFYALASFFVFPSLYEGFGLPVLEAMRRGVPVACSNTSSLPEVAGDAALLFDPNSTEEIAGAMETLLDNGEVAERLRTAGPERTRLFTWEQTARATAEAYERAAGA
jgi:glycosyltransferase involved in cell wall biosynthesis